MVAIMGSAGFIDEIELTWSEAVRNEAPSKLVAPYSSWVKPKKCGDFGSGTMAIAFSECTQILPVNGSTWMAALTSILEGSLDKNRRLFGRIGGG